MSREQGGAGEAEQARGTALQVLLLRIQRIRSTFLKDAIGAIVSSRCARLRSVPSLARDRGISCREQRVRLSALAAAARRHQSRMGEDM